MCLYDKARALLCAIDTFDITGSTLLCNINVVNDDDDVDIDVDVDGDDVDGDGAAADRQCVIAVEESGQSLLNTLNTLNTLNSIE